MPGFLVRPAGQGNDGSVPGGGGALLVQAEDEADAKNQGADIFGIDPIQVIVEPYEFQWSNL